MLGFIGLTLYDQFSSETQHFGGYIILFDSFNPTYQNVEFRLLSIYPIDSRLSYAYNRAGSKYIRLESAMTEKSDNLTNPTVALIERLSLAVGITGYTGANNIQDVVAAELAPHVDRVDRDRIGSVIGVKEGRQTGSAGQKRHKIMLAAHLDEIGAVVTKLDQGFLRFTQIGGLDDRVLMGQEVMVHGRRDLPGIIGSIPPHLLPSGRANNTVDQREMHIDVGLPSAQAAQLIQIGDLVSFNRSPENAAWWAVKR